MRVAAVLLLLCAGAFAIELPGPVQQWVQGHFSPEIQQVAQTILGQIGQHGNIQELIHQFEQSAVGQAALLDGKLGGLFEKVQQLINGLKGQLSGRDVAVAAEEIEREAERLLESLMPIVENLVNVGQGLLTNVAANGLVWLHQFLGTVGKRETEHGIEDLIAPLLQQLLTQLLGSLGKRETEHGIEDLIAPLLQQLLTQLLGSLGKRETEHGIEDLIAPLLQQLLTQLLGSFGKRGIEDLIAPLLQQLLTQLLGSLGKRGIEDLIAPLLQQLLTQLLGGLGKRDLQSVLQTIKDKIQNHPNFEQIKQFLQNHLSTIVQHIKDAVANIKNLITAGKGSKRDLFAGLTSQLQAILDAAKQQAANLLGQVTPHLSDLQDQLGNHLLNALESIKGSLGNIKDTVLAGY